MEKMTPGTVVAATYALGGTDAPWFRQATPGVVAYGFCPSFDRRAANGEGLLHVSNEADSGG